MTITKLWCGRCGEGRAITRERPRRTCVVCGESLVLVTWTVPGQDGPKHSQTMALAFDYEEYSAELYTRPNFGCVQHEPQEDVT